jgi:thiol-disulfide isomerase/thioredoxin
MNLKKDGHLPKRWLKRFLFIMLGLIFLTACGATKGGKDLTKSGDSQQSTQKPTLIYFMASWCPSCVSEEKVFKKIHATYGDNINLMTVDVDPKNDTKTDLEAFQKQYGGNWTHKIDEDYQLAKKYQIKQLEEVFLVNANQKVVYHAVDPFFQDLQNELSQIGVKGS